MVTVRMFIPYMNMKSRFEAAVSRLEPQDDVRVELLHVFGTPESLSRYGDADILVARGMTYDRLRYLFPEKHVVEIQLSSFDILKALICARQEFHPKKIALCATPRPHSMKCASTPRLTSPTPSARSPT